MLTRSPKSVGIQQHPDSIGHRQRSGASRQRPPRPPAGRGPTDRGQRTGGRDLGKRGRGEHGSTRCVDTSPASRATLSSVRGPMTWGRNRQSVRRVESPSDLRGRATGREDVCQWTSGRCPRAVDGRGQGLRADARGQEWCESWGLRSLVCSMGCEVSVEGAASNTEQSGQFFERFAVRVETQHPLPVTWAQLRGLRCR